MNESDIYKNARPIPPAAPLPHGVQDMVDAGKLIQLETLDFQAGLMPPHPDVEKLNSMRVGTECSVANALNKISFKNPKVAIGATLLAGLTVGAIAWGVKSSMSRRQKKEPSPIELALKGTAGTQQPGPAI